MTHPPPPLYINMWFTFYLFENQIQDYCQTLYKLIPPPPFENQIQDYCQTLYKVQSYL